MGSSNSDICEDKTENSLGERDYWVLLINEFGNITWQNTIGGNNMEIGFPMIYDSDGLLLGGHSTSDISGDKTKNSKGSRDFWVLKLNPLLSISQNELAASINIFPNPTEDILQINSHSHIIDSLKIFDTRGSLVKEFKNAETVLKINISDFSAGVYFLQMFSNEKTVIKKFIKK